MSKRFWDRASLRHAIKSHSLLVYQSVIDALETDNKWFFREKLDCLIQQDFRFFQVSGHHGWLRCEIDGILVAWIFAVPRLNFLARQIVFLIPDVDLHDAVANRFAG